MKKTHFLDKIYNANPREFDNIIITLMKDLEQQNFPYSYFKSDNKWVIEIEKENTLIKKSARIIKSTMLGEELKVIPGLYHGEFSINKSDDYVAEIRRIIVKDEFKGGIS